MTATPANTDRLDEKSREMLRDFTGLEPTEHLCAFHNDDEGVVNDWLCRVVYKRERENSCLSPELAAKFEEKPIVEFYSLATHQFVSSYYIETILGKDGFGGGYGHGLCLDGGVARWTMSVEAIDEVRDWCLAVEKELEAASTAGAGNK